MGQVGNVAFLHLVADAIRLAQINGLVGFAVGGEPKSARNIHAHMLGRQSPAMSRTKLNNCEVRHVYVNKVKT
jgi:hypothetical protein